MSHPLIHTYTRHRLQESTDVAQHRCAVARLVTVLAAHFPEVELTNWADCERLVPHIQACAIQLEQQQEGLVEALPFSIKQETTYKNAAGMSKPKSSSHGRNDPGTGA